MLHLYGIFVGGLLALLQTNQVSGITDKRDSGMVDHAAIWGE